MNTPMLSSIDVFRRLAGAELPDWPLLQAGITARILKAREPLFQAGERRPAVFVVNRGLIKMVYETPEGDTWIKGFATPGVCFASLTALADRGVTSYSAYAITEACVDQVDHQALMALAARHLVWQRALSNAFEFYGQRKERREMELLTLSPEARYQRFLHDHREIVPQLTQREMASYVRVTPVALSRIKSRLKAKQRSEPGPG